MDRISAASLVQGSSNAFDHFRGLCQLEPVLSTLRRYRIVPKAQINRLRLFLQLVFADANVEDALRPGSKHRSYTWTRNQAELVRQDIGVLVLLGLCLTQTQVSDFGEDRLSILLVVAQELASEPCCQPVLTDPGVQVICRGMLVSLYKENCGYADTVCKQSSATS